MIRCLAIDDETLALDLIRDNIGKVPFLELAGTCKSAFEAMELLREEKIDLLFLDIQMPDLSGIQFLKSLQSKPLVIFTTAYEKYALEGFELDVIDYLLKPFSFDRFLKAVNKAKDYLDLKERAVFKDAGAGNASEAGYIFVKADYKLVKIDFSEILYIEGLKDYIKICTGGKPVLTLMNMKSIGEKLPAKEFARVHRSFIVALKKIKFIQRNNIHIGDREIPISDMYKEHFFSLINQDKTGI
jgi:two-component system, LytTR family, response regulator